MPTACAGQAFVQRPHSVHATPSINCFQVKCFITYNPTFVYLRSFQFKLRFNKRNNAGVFFQIFEYCGDNNFQGDKGYIDRNQIDGMGKFAFEAILQRDYIVIMATTVLSAILTLVGILLSDLLYVIIDPRITFD